MCYYVAFISFYNKRFSIRTLSELVKEIIEIYDSMEQYQMTDWNVLISFVIRLDVGHLAFLKEAKKRGDYLIVGLHSDKVRPNTILDIRNMDFLVLRDFFISRWHLRKFKWRSITLVEGYL